MPVDSAELSPDAAEQPAWAAPADPDASLPSASLPADLDFQVGPALTAILEGGTTLEAGSDGFVHLLLVATDSLAGTPVDLTLLPLEVAIVSAGPPLAGDWREGRWLPRLAAPAGSYAAAAVGPDNALPLPLGSYWLYARVTCGAEQYVLRSAGTFRVCP